MDDIAIKVDGVSKEFLLPHERTQSLKTAFVSALKGRRNKTTERQQALQDISFEVKKGEFFGIVGRNGSGKSTLLKILAQIYQPTEGNVTVNGRLVPFIELGVGFNPELTGRDNVYLSGSLMGFSEKEIDAMYDDIVSFAELEKFMDQKLKNYSSGMQVRLAFSVAVRADADILLIDEVLAVGDADFQKKCYNYFLKLKAANKTVVFVSHDMSAVRLYCERAILIDDSRLIKESTADVVSMEYTKLFEQTSSPNAEEQKTQRGNGERWGTQSAVFTDIKAPTGFKSDSLLVFSVDVSANQDIEEPVFGFSVKNAAKERLIGTNNVILKNKLKAMRKGDKLRLECSVPALFSSGIYTIDVALQTQAYEYIDYWQDASEFTVTNEQNTPYKISPPIKLSIRPTKNETKKNTKAVN